MTAVPDHQSSRAAAAADVKAFLSQPWLQVLLAWLLYVYLVNWDWPAAGIVFSDTDDGMRLQQVRDLLAGQSWFDLVQHRLDPDMPVPSHWSRLIDAPIAGLMALVAIFTSAQTAEKVVMLVWPPVTFLPALAALRLAAVRLSGPERAGWAGPVALFIGLTCMAVNWQFAPLRIDHHNVQLALGAGLMAALLGQGRKASAQTAGAICGLMLAIAFETLPLVVIAALCIAWRYATDPDARDEAALFGLSLAGVTTALFFATTPVSRYGVATCDALSVSMAGPAVAGGLALAGLSRLAGDNRFLRWGGLLAVAAGCLAFFAWIEPACLRGPFAQIDPAIRSIWLDHVGEVQPIWNVWKDSRLHVFLATTHVALALLLAPLVVKAAPGPSRAPALALVAAVLVSTVIGLLQIRQMGYANLLTVPLLASSAALLCASQARAGRSALLAAMGCSLLFSNFTLGVLLTAFPQVQGEGEAQKAKDLGQRNLCFDSRIYAPLAGEPRGLVLNGVESGPFLLLQTPHTVMSAPYHRNSHGMLAAHRILTATPADARRLMREAQVDMVALCAHSGSFRLVRDESKGGLAAALARGDVPDWLEPIAVTPDLMAYRVRPGP